MNGNDGAFPMHNPEEGYSVAGLTKREFFAAMALQTIITGMYSLDLTMEQMADISVKAAEALIKSLNK